MTTPTVIAILSVCIAVVAVGLVLLLQWVRDLRLEVTYLRRLTLEIGQYSSMVHNLVALRRGEMEERARDDE